MKRIKSVFLVFFVSLIFTSSFAAAPTPPEPMRAQAVNADDDAPPPPPPKDTPIDANIVLLLVGGITLGMSVIYKNKIKKALI